MSSSTDGAMGSVIGGKRHTSLSDIVKWCDGAYPTGRCKDPIIIDVIIGFLVAEDVNSGDGSKEI